jgi:beta-galactosidase
MKFSRRQLIQGTMAASASVAVSRSGVANIVDHMSPTAPVGQSGLAPRQHLLFDRNWRFTFGNAADASKDLGFDGPGDFSKQGRFKFALADFDDSKWDSVTLPHDWSNGLKHIKDDHMKGHGYFPVGRKYPGNSIGWYRRTFLLPAGSEGKRILLEFDGIYHRSQVFINGSYLDSHESGYSPVTYDITDFLDYKGKNTITVRDNHHRSTVPRSI